MSSLTRGRGVAAVILAACALTLTACGGARDEQPGTGRLTIATGNTTGVYYQLGGALARVISADLDRTATATETGGSIQNIRLVVAGKQDIAFSLLDTAADAVRGREAFAGKPQPIEALTGLYPNYTQVVARTASGIRSIADMRGKRVATGSPQSGTEVIAQRLLQAAGLDPVNDIKRQRLSLDKSVEAMKDGAIDALFWSGGLPTPGIKDLFTSAGSDVRLLDLLSHLTALRSRYGDFYEPGRIPGSTYATNPVKTIIVGNVLLVRHGFDAALADRLVRLIFGRQAELTAATPAAKAIAPSGAMDVQPLQLNPGAQRALDALGSNQ